jgi:AraC-like DNA-binding protein
MKQFPADYLNQYPSVKTRLGDMGAIYIISHQNSHSGNVLQTSHCLEIVLKGQCKVSTSLVEQTIKASHLQFRKRGNYIFEPTSDYISVIYFLENQFIIDFLDEHVETYSKDTFNSEIPPFLFATNAFMCSNVNETISVIMNQREFQSCISKLALHHILLQILDKNPNKSFVTFLKYLISNRKLDLSFFMEKNFTQILDIKTLAKQTGRSISSFKIDFKKEFQSTPMNWIKNRRLKHAQYLIQNTKDNITDIAYECGFENVSHFSKAYSDKFGVSPSKSRF